MDLRRLKKRLESGEKLSVTYEYPSKRRDARTGSIYRVRTDRLLDIAPSRKRLFVCFNDEFPAWIESYEVIEVSPEADVRKATAA
jgi:hypothetical protein